jgi:hypothetical protein
MPLELDVTYEDGEFCATVNGVSGIHLYVSTTQYLSISGTQSYFSIVRIQNWKTVQKKNMSNTNAALSYTLGALFTVVAVASFVEVCYALYCFVKAGSFRTSYIYIIAIYAFTQSM